MNLVGKIFIVLIFVMSLLWMGFSVAVYATHQNWKDLVENPETGLKQQLQRAQERNEELKAREAKLDADLTTEKAARRMAVTKLEAENDDLDNQRAQQKKDLTDLVQERDDAFAALKATQDAEAALRAEVVGLRDEIRQAQQERDAQFKEAVQLQEQLHQASLQLQTLKERLTTLTEDLTKAKTVLDKFGLKGEPGLYQGTPWSDVDGVILAVGGNGLVEVSIGSDDSLLKGHQLEVYRQGDGVSAWLGRIEVTETSVDKAVCKVLPEFLQRPMQRGDRVTTKLR